MTLLAPLALVGLLVPAAIYLIHLLFGSRKRVRVPALFLWADLPQASAGRSRRRWPPITLLLLLQLLAATLAVLALSRPATPSDPPRHLALILDASASMQATDVAPTRFAAAKARGLDRLQALTPRDLVTLIRADAEASVVSQGSADTARAALGAAQPGNTSAAVREALALASTKVAATPDHLAQIVLLTDAAWPPPAPVGPLAGPVEVLTVGGGSDNQAVTTLAVRMDPSGRAQTAFVELANHADHPARVPMRLLADGAPLDERQVEIGPRARARLSIPLPVEARRISVRLLGRDALSLDDQAETIAPGGPPRDVLLVGHISDGLKRALESVPSLRVRASDQPDAGQTKAPDLTVLQATLPPQLPPGPLLLVNPPPSSARLLGVGLGSGARVQAGHPLLQALDLAALRNETPQISGVPGWARVVFGTQQGPLVMEGSLEGRPTVALTFDPSISGLEKSLAFPLLISNASTFLMNHTELAAGSPDGAFDASESDIAPRPVPAFQVSPPVRARPNAGEAQTGLAEHWPWIAAGCLVLLAAEWLVFARRG